MKINSHNEWDKLREGELAALSTIDPPSNSSCLVCRSSTLILPEALTRLSQARAEVAIGCYKPNGG